MQSEVTKSADHVPVGHLCRFLGPLESNAVAAGPGTSPQHGVAEPGEFQRSPGAPQRGNGSDPRWMKNTPTESVYTRGKRQNITFDIMHIHT